MEQQQTRAEKRAATAARILEAAQQEFAEHGAENATIRAIARRAGVDPSLVLQHYGSKQSLFSLAVRPAEDLATDEVPTHLGEVLRLRLDDLPSSTRALLRSMLTSPEAARVMSEYLQERTQNLARALDGDDAEVRAAIIVSSIMGVTVARHLLDLPALADADPGVVEKVVDGWLDPGSHAVPDGS